MRIKTPFLPTSISGCQVWLDASDPTTIGLSGTSANTWVSKLASPSITATYSGTAPTYTTYNTYPALQFNGSSTKMTTGTIASYGSSGSTWIAASVNLTAVTSSTPVDASVVIASPGAPERAIRYGNNTAATCYSIHTSVLRQDTNNNANGVRGFIDTPISLQTFTNGTNIVTVNTAVTFQTSVNQSFDLGQWNVGWLNGYIFECVVYDGILTLSQYQQVEGYLATKWGFRNLLPQGHPGVTGVLYPLERKPMMFPFGYHNLYTPRSVTSAAIALWLDAADATTITGTSPITGWTDKSGLSRPVTIVSGPTYGTTTRNGLNTLSFSSNSITTSIASAVGTGDFALIAVWFQSSAGTNTVLSLGTSASSSQSLGFSGNKYNFYQYGSAFESSYSATTPSWVIQLGTRISSVKKVYINGNVGTTGTFDSFNQTVTTVTIGNGDSLPISGQLAEVLIYTGTLSTADQQQVESYLAQKWGLTVSLPAGHINATKPAGTPAIIAQLYPQVKRNLASLSRIVTTVSTFTYTTGVYQYFTVPSGITSITLLMWGAGGGGIAGYTPCTGGSGACIQGDLAVTPGEILTIVVGYGGQSSQSGTTTDEMGGGGTGYNGNRGYGGGRSAIQRTAGTDIVTVGGGGGSDMANSRAAGAATGSGTAHQGNMGAKTTGASGSHGGGGGQTSGGIGGSQSGFTGGTGTKGFGGASGRGGGGGGWWGGGGAGGNNTVSGESGSGGGGSSFIDNLTAGSITTYDGFGVTGNATRLAPNSSSPFYNNYALGGTYNANAGNGAVIISYSVAR